MKHEPDLARQVDAAQSILATPAAEQARVLERAVAESGAAVAAAMARLDPASGASAREIAGGIAIYAGAGSPLTQGLAMGLRGPVSSEDLDAMERHVCPLGTGAKQLELCPFVDPTLPALLAGRGYRLNEWQLVWVCDLSEAPREPVRPADAALRVRRVRPGEEDAMLRAMLAGFLETEEVPDSALGLLRPVAFADRHELYAVTLGDELIGGGALAHFGGVAIVSGSGVRPVFRGRGAQGQLLRVRLERARELGCTVATSSTLPGTSSRRNMERCGFRVAYPKVVMLRDA